MAEKNGNKSIPILELSTILPERRKIRIKTKDNPAGNLYELRERSEFSVAEAQSLRVKALRLKELSSKTVELEDDEKTDLANAVHFFARLVIVGVPEDVLWQLSDQQKMMVANLFTPTPAEQETAPEGAKASR